MLHKNICYVFERAVKAEICDEIIAHMDANKKIKATLAGKKQNVKQRKGSVMWKKPRAFHDLILPYFDKANQQGGYNYQFDMFEDIQLAQYDKGDHFNWHEDTLTDPFDNGKIRKLSMSINLSDEKDYVGGHFKFRRLDRGKIVDFQPVKFRKKGSVIVFPSPTMHTVTPIKKGRRYALVAWALGSPFK
jgi:hypothetical protein|tara:strand:- start:1454 stop:2020 length:567 start_codon:yes stop_codon:yes gene_type:complete